MRQAGAQCSPAAPPASSLPLSRGEGRRPAWVSQPERLCPTLLAMVGLYTSLIVAPSSNAALGNCHRPTPACVETISSADSHGVRCTRAVQRAATEHGPAQRRALRPNPRDFHPSARPRRQTGGGGVKYPVQGTVGTGPAGDATGHQGRSNRRSLTRSGVQSMRACHGARMSHVLHWLWYCVAGNGLRHRGALRVCGLWRACFRIDAPRTRRAPPYPLCLR